MADNVDIEGAEFGVLKTVPWDKLDIKVLLVELIHAGNVNKGSREEVLKFLFSIEFFCLKTTVLQKNFFIQQTSEAQLTARCAQSTC